MQEIRNPTDAAKFVASVIRRHVPDPAYRVFLFESRATGAVEAVKKSGVGWVRAAARRRADVDLSPQAGRGSWTS